MNLTDQKIKNLRHLAIIMDGNRRWASQKKLPIFLGHKEGVKTLRKILELSSQKEIKYLTCFAFSTENWNRSKEETNFLVSLLENSIQKEIKDLIKNQVRVRFIGNLATFDQTLQKKIKDLELKTKNFKKIGLQIAINYGARQDIIRATNNLLNNYSRFQADQANKQITESEFSEQLQTKDLPEPDLLIRTGGEFRVSNFLLWELAYTELFFSEKMWPDFKESDFEEALGEFNKRKRRFGA